LLANIDHRKSCRCFRRRDLHSEAPSTPHPTHQISLSSTRCGEHPIPCLVLGFPVDVDVARKTHIFGSRSNDTVPICHHRCLSWAMGRFCLNDPRSPRGTCRIWSAQPSPARFIFLLNLENSLVNTDLVFKSYKIPQVSKIGDSNSWMLQSKILII
jgi:hypothetical protein